MQQAHRLLTYDEKKAAEAAFKGSPIDPKWSESARIVYVGLSLAMANQRNEAFQEVRPLQVTTIANSGPSHRVAIGMECELSPGVADS
jgi:hypothetical protein